MLKSTVIILFVFSTSVVTVFSKKNPDITLLYNPNPKKNYNYELKQSIVQELSDMNIVSQIILNADAELKAKKNKSEISITGKYPVFKATVAGMGMAGINDTTGETRNNEELNDNLIITNLGEKIEYIRMKESSVDISKLDPEQLGKTLFYGSSPFFIEFPERKLSVGDSWEVEMTGLAPNVNSAFNLSDQKTKLTYTYIGTKDTLGKKCIVIKCKSTDFTMKSDINQMGVDLQMEGEGIVKGTYFYDEKDCMPVLCSMTVDTDMRVAAKGQEASISALNITLSVYLKTKEIRK